MSPTPKSPSRHREETTLRYTRGTNQHHPPTFAQVSMLSQYYDI